MFKMLKKSVLALAIGTVTALGLHAAAQAQPKLEEVKVALFWLRNGEVSSLMVADAKGYFAEQGLKVTLVDGGPGRNPVPVVGAGQADFGVAPGSEVVRARLAPAPVDVVAIGSMEQVMPLAYIKLGNPGDPDPTPKDLEGKTVGIQAPGKFFLESMLKRNNIDPSKVKTSIVLGTPEPLMVGKVDYFAGFLTNQTYQIEQEALKPNAPPAVKGKTWKAIPFYKYGLAMPTNVVFATNKTLKERPETVRKFMRALAMGMKFDHENTAEAIKLVDAYPAQLERADKLAWRAKIQHPLEVNSGTQANGLLWTDPKVWTEMMDFYKEAGEINRVVPASEVMTNAFNAGIKLAK
ncbi:ABC transporter substrate-binding protein [Variovorax rhizosphaerae]|uniref:ABC transporter substrate-binding protein n=1 Tax=Variovorax rhizosphaerae TaxID=1836200 RepID=A0ABU8WLA0_9BURK